MILYLNSQSFSEMDNSVQEHATKIREGLYWSKNKYFHLVLPRRESYGDKVKVSSPKKLIILIAIP